MRAKIWEKIEDKERLAEIQSRKIFQMVLFFLKVGDTVKNKIIEGSLRHQSRSWRVLQKDEKSAESIRVKKRSFVLR